MKTEASLPSHYIDCCTYAAQNSILVEMGRLKAELLLAREDLLAERATRLRSVSSSKAKDC